MWAIDHGDYLTFEWLRAHAPSSKEFAVYNEVPNAITALTDSLGVVFEWPDLKKLLTRTMRDRAATVPGLVWRDVEIRAKNQGVNIHAVDDGADWDELKDAADAMKMGGLVNTMQVFASSAMEGLVNDPTEDQLREAAKRVLAAMLREWEPSRYGVMVAAKDRPPEDGTTKELALRPADRELQFRAYFGNEGSLDGSHRWVSCDTGRGGAAGVGAYLLGALRAETGASTDG